MSKRPNILLIMADQLSDAWLDVAKTPALDRLISKGARFNNAYSNSPLCAPARSAMLTGRLNSSIGAYDNAAELPASIPTFAHHLRSAGYQTCLVGKMHFVGPDQMHGYEERLSTDIYPVDFGWTPDWDNPDDRFDWWYHNMTSVTDAGVVEASNQLDYDDEAGFQAVRKIRDLARTKDERPWMLTVSFTHPHDPYLTRQEFWDLYNDDEIPMPAVEQVPDPDPHSQRLAHMIESDTTPPTEDEVRTARHAYLANVSYVDSLIGDMLDALERLGMDENTVILFTTDHGDMLGERGLWYKMSFFEHSARIPMIVSGAGVEPSSVDTPVSLLDVLPTLLSLGSCDEDDEAVGSDLLKVASGSDPDRTVLGEYMGEGAVAAVLMIRRGTEKFIWSAADPPQLYDLATDPSELNNLAETQDVSDWEEEVRERWDAEAIDDAVRRSQEERRLVDHAHRQGAYTGWDYQPHTDASEQYMRNHLDLNEVESGRRL